MSTEIILAIGLGCAALGFGVELARLARNWSQRSWFEAGFREGHKCGLMEAELKEGVKAQFARQNTVLSKDREARS